jgi:hypothetical protein
VSIASLASHTGSFELAYDFNGIISNVVSEKKCKIEIQFSDNGTSVVKTIDISDDNHCHVEAHYFRVKITNQGTTTDAIDCHTYLSLSAINTSSVAQQASQTQQLQSINEKLAGTLNVAIDNQSNDASLESTQMLVKQELTGISNKLPSSLGAKNASQSVSVVVAPDSNPVAVSLDDVPLPKGASTEATLLQVKNITEVQSATLTSGLGSINTRLQGWDSAIGSIATTSQATAGRLPASIGQKTTAQSLSVCLSSDASALKVRSEQFGSLGNVALNATIDVSSASASLDISQLAYMYGFYEDASTSSSATIIVEYSFDGTTYFNSGTTLFAYVPSGDTKRRAQIYRQEVAGINHVRFRNTSATDSLTGVTITILGASMG